MELVTAELPKLELTLVMKLRPGVRAAQRGGRQGGSTRNPRA